MPSRRYLSVNFDMHTLSFAVSIAAEFSRKIVAPGHVLVHAEKLRLQQRKIELAPKLRAASFRSR